MSKSLTTDNRLIILDIGSRFIRSGFVGDGLPKSTVALFSSGKTDHIDDWKLPPYFNLNDYSLTDAQYSTILRELLSNKHVKALSDIYSREMGCWIPIRGHGLDRQDELTIIKKLNLIIKDKLSLSTNRLKIILVDNGLPADKKLKLLEILLEILRVKSVVILPSPVLSMIGSNVSDGLFINFGWNSFMISPVIDLRILDKQAYENFDEFNSLSLHYKIVEELLKQDNPEIDQLLERSDSFNLIESFIINAVYVRPLSLREDDVECDTTFELSPGVKIPDCLRYQVIEDLFFSSNKLSYIVKSVIDACTVDSRNHLRSNIVVTGGLSNIPGFKSRLSQEMNCVFHETPVTLKRCLGAWTGCSLYVSNVLLNQKKMIWKSMEIDKEKLSSLSLPGLEMFNYNSHLDSKQ